MFLHLACLPLAAVLINDVRSENPDGTLTVDVATSEPVSRADVRGVSGGARRMYVYVQGAQAGRGAFGRGPDAIVVHPRARYTKLEIPTGGRCAEPMSVESTPAGIRVRASCQNTGIPAGMVAPPVRLPGNDRAEQPSPEAPMAALAHRRSQSESLRAALALPPEATDKESDGALPEDRVRGAAAEEASDKKARAAAMAAAVAEKPADPPVANADKPAAARPAPLVPQPDAPMAAVASTDSPGPSSSGSAGSESKSLSNTLSTVLAALLLAGLGVAATVLARRRATRTRVIRIVETASIGPRRSLVVANIGGRTMVLGVSEAGVALLDAHAGTIGTASAAPETSQSASFEEAALGLRAFGQSHGEAQKESADEAKHEGSLLGRLFHRVQPPSESARRAHDFDDLLSESLEDQDLRRKLSLGEAGRVA
jgi:flagellar biogenesis protein FliO